MTLKARVYDWKEIQRQLEDVGDRLQRAVGPARAVGLEHGILVDVYHILGVLVAEKVEQQDLLEKQKRQVRGDLPLVAANDMMSQGVSPPPGYDIAVCSTPVGPEGSTAPSGYGIRVAWEFEGSPGTPEYIDPHHILKRDNRDAVQWYEIYTLALFAIERLRQDERRAAIGTEDIAREYFEHGWGDSFRPQWKDAREDVKQAMRGHVTGVREAMQRLDIG